MVSKPTYEELEHKIDQLECRLAQYAQKEKAFDLNQKRFKYNHLRRTVCLIKINEELNGEIESIKHGPKGTPLI